MANKKNATVGQLKSAVDLAIEMFRSAYAEWEGAMPPVLTEFLDARGNGYAYWMPTEEQFIADAVEGAPPSDVADRTTNPAWQRAHDACAAARTLLAASADGLAAIAVGTGNATRILHNCAKRLAALLRDVPPVWPTSIEKKLSFEISNTFIAEFLAEAEAARLRQQLEEERATEERRKEKSERAADVLINWAEQKKRGGARKKLSNSSRREPSAMQQARRMDVLRALPSSDRVGMDRPSVLLAKLRRSEAETRQAERIAIRHDKDTVRRDLQALRSETPTLVHPVLLLRTAAGDERVARSDQ